jgi:predicted TIM-barrel enzyme
MFITRQEILRRFHAQVAAGKPVIGCGVGVGISAKMAEAGGADMIVICNADRYCMAGRKSLAGLMPYGDANDVVIKIAAEVLPVVKNIPVLAGVNGTDPFRVFPIFLKQLSEMGFSGVHNFPTVGLIDGNFRANLECADMGYDKEIEMIAVAHEMNLFTSPYVFDVNQAKAMVKAGADQLVIHMGLARVSATGTFVPQTLEDAVARVIEIAEAGRNIRKNILVTLHGGLFDELENVEKALLRIPKIHGFLGSFSIECLPMACAIRHQVESLKALAIA